MNNWEDIWKTVCWWVPWVSYMFEFLSRKEKQRETHVLRYQTKMPFHYIYGTLFLEKYDLGEWRLIPCLKVLYKDDSNCFIAVCINGNSISKSVLLVHGYIFCGKTSQ